jgi:hypothetical protein
LLHMQQSFVNAGNKVKLPNATVVWLSKEK